jgi:hypothetical protein
VGTIRSWEVVMESSVQLENYPVSLVQFYHDLGGLGGESGAMVSSIAHITLAACRIATFCGKISK